MVRCLGIAVAFLAVLTACGARSTLILETLTAGSPDGGVEAGASEAGTADAGDAACSTGGIVKLASEPMPETSLPEVVALDDANVYFWLGALSVSSAGASILSIPKCGGNVVTLASDQPSPSGLAADGVSVYWTTASTSGTGTVMSVPRGGGTPVTVAVAFDPFQVVVDATNVYWTDPALDAVLGAPKGGGVPLTLASQQHGPQIITFDDQNLYWTNAGDETGPSGVVSVAKAGGVPVTLAAANFAYGIAVDTTNVYWYTTDAGGANASLMRVALTGGAAVKLTSVMPNVGALAVDGVNLYWTDDGNGDPGTVMSIPKLGGTPATIASGQSGPAGLAVDATSVYWANDIVEILKAPK